MEKGYMATFARAYKGKDQNVWTGLVLEGDMHSAFKPNRVHKRLLNKAYKTKDEAISSAESFMKKNDLNAWVGKVGI